MTVPSVAQEPAVSSQEVTPEIWKTVLGAGIALGLSSLFYLALLFVLNHLPPIAVDAAPLVRSISRLVRHLIVGTMVLVTFMFGTVGLGLFAYSGQLGWQKLRPRS
jgi:hypothetical protein